MFVLYSKIPSSECWPRAENKARLQDWLKFPMRFPCLKHLSVSFQCSNMTTSFFFLTLNLSPCFLPEPTQPFHLSSVSLFSLSWFVTALVQVFLPLLSYISWALCKQILPSTESCSVCWTSRAVHSHRLVWFLFQALPLLCPFSPVWSQL